MAATTSANPPRTGACARKAKNRTRKTGTNPRTVDQPRINRAESPLAWLAARKGADGAPLIDAACLEAGERLRRDLTLAGALPSVAMNWDRMATGAVDGGGAGDGGRADPTQTRLSARQRIDRVFAAIDGEDCDLLIDLCGFLKPLQTIERERGWPQRSGKILVVRALRRLAAHYGLAAEARGRARARMTAWHAEMNGTGA